MRHRDSNMVDSQRQKVRSPSVDTKQRDYERVWFLFVDSTPHFVRDFPPVVKRIPLFDRRQSKTDREKGILAKGNQEHH